MKALLSVRPGGPETLVLEERPPLVPGPGELVLRVLACGINYPDVLIIEDCYQLKPPRPFAPGTEMAGIVEAVGAQAEGWTVGDRVLAIADHGGLAEQAIVAASNAFHLPEGLSAIEGAGLLVTYGTALHALADRGALAAGEILLVLGAAGGVGLAAIQIGKALGARVVAAVSSEEKAGPARAAGADACLVYPRAPFDESGTKALTQSFKAAVSGGADVILDPIGGDYCEPALRAIAPDGRYLVTGFAAGIPRLPLNLSLLKSCDIRGVYCGAFAARHPERYRRNIEKLIGWWQAGRITPCIDRIYPLDRGGDAIARLGGRSAIGKVVVTVAGLGDGKETPD